LFRHDDGDELLIFTRSTQSQSSQRQAGNSATNNEYRSSGSQGFVLLGRYFQDGAWLEERISAERFL